MTTPTSAELSRWIADIKQPATLTDGETIREIAERTGRPESKVARLLKGLMDAGCVTIGKARRPTLAGYSRTFTVFKIVEPANEPARKRRNPKPQQTAP